MFLMVKVRVSPGLRFGSPVSPMLASSPTLLAPVVTGAGGSPPKVMGSLSNATLVLRTTASWSMVPVLLTTKVTFPAGAVAGDTARVMGPARPLVSPNVTCTVVLGGVVPVGVVPDPGILTPSSNDAAPVPLELAVLAHPATPPRIAINAIPVSTRRPRPRNGIGSQVNGVSVVVSQRAPTSASVPMRKELDRRGLGRRSLSSKSGLTVRRGCGPVNHPRGPMSSRGHVSRIG